MPEFETLVVTDGWHSLLQGRARVILERDVLPAFLAGRRWFAERATPRYHGQTRRRVPLAAGDPGIALAMVEAKGRRERPLNICCR